MNNTKRLTKFLDIEQFNKMILYYPSIANILIGIIYGQKQQFPNFLLFIIAPFIFWAKYIIANKNNLKNAATYIYTKTPKKYRIRRIISIPICFTGFLFFYNLSQDKEYICTSYCLNSLSFQYSLSGCIFVFTGALIFTAIFFHDEIVTNS